MCVCVCVKDIFNSNLQYQNTSSSPSALLLSVRSSFSSHTLPSPCTSLSLRHISQGHFIPTNQCLCPIPSLVSSSLLYALGICQTDRGFGGGVGFVFSISSATWPLVACSPGPAVFLTLEPSRISEGINMDCPSVNVALSELQPRYGPTGPSNKEQQPPKPLNPTNDTGKLYSSIPALCRLRVIKQDKLCYMKGFYQRATKYLD